MPLAKQHVLSDYYTASQQDESSPSEESVVEGVVYVETDVRYETPSGDLTTWAKGPLDEIKFLRRIVEGGYGDRDSKMLQGIVAWAPVDQPPSILEEWLDVAEKTAGSKTWKRVKGFRFLLQFIHDQEKFEKLVLGKDFVRNLQILGESGFSFDIGVDQRSGGSWQLEAVCRAMKMAHEGLDKKRKVTFVVNHLCKPDFEASPEEFGRWKSAVEEMARFERTYMKLSGAFSELPEGLSSTEIIAAKMRPWMEHVLKCFGPGRVMFGSDWPVCNVSGPKGEQSWLAWRDVIGAILDDRRYGHSPDDQARIWKETARQAYRLD